MRAYMKNKKKQKVGFVGWRGMVGSVLFDRMKEENNFKNISTVFLSTSQVGNNAPFIKDNEYEKTLQDAYDINFLFSLDIIITCYGTEYTNLVYGKLRSIGWKGYWIDASSILRMDKKACIVLDPINIKMIHDSINSGIKTFVGANCTVSLMLIALGGLFLENLIEWISFSTYQAASGAGAKHMLELLNQTRFVSNSISRDVISLNKSSLELEKLFTNSCNLDIFPKNCFRSPLVGNALPWIDELKENGQTKEEWKMQAETNKILKTDKNILIDGNCVRIATLRCHSLSLTIKLKKNISIKEIENILKNSNSWISIISNEKESTLNDLNPIGISGSLFVRIGRIRKLNIGKNYLSVFIVGDQLLWGAAEPLRRMLEILVN